MFYVYMLWTFYVRFAYPYHGYGTLIEHFTFAALCQTNEYFEEN